MTDGATYTNNTDAEGFILQIDNFGIGPAKVGSVKLTLDGPLRRSWIVRSDCYQRGMCNPVNRLAKLDREADLSNRDYRGPS